MEMGLCDESPIPSSYEVLAFDTSLKLFHFFSLFVFFEHVTYRGVLGQKEAQA